MCYLSKTPVIVSLMLRPTELLGEFGLVFGVVLLFICLFILPKQSTIRPWTTNNISHWY